MSSVYTTKIPPLKGNNPAYTICFHLSLFPQMGSVFSVDAIHG